MADTSLSHHEDNDLLLEPHSTPKIFSKQQQYSELTPATAAESPFSSSGGSVWGGEEYDDTYFAFRNTTMSVPKAIRPSIDPNYARRLPPPSPSSRAALPPTTGLTPPPTVQRSLFTEDLFAAAKTSPEPRSPAPKRPKAGDRYIPSRQHQYSSIDTSLWENIARQDAKAEASDELAAVSTEPSESTTDRSSVFSSILHRNTLSSLLSSEVLHRDENEVPRFRFTDTTTTTATSMNAVVHSFGLSPCGVDSQKLVAAPSKRKRKIPKVPFKVLDAPALQDDFYLNLVDWSSQNVLAVGLGSCVYLWSACTSKVTKLCDLTPEEDVITAVSWAARGIHLSVGTNKGEVQLWDTIRCKKVRSMGGHTARVGTLAWSGALLASGSRDRLIYLRDVRVQEQFTQKLSNHRQEVCGLKWSFEEPAFLASGGNDNNLHVIDSRNPIDPLHKFTDHTAAVKAIAWSPHQHGLLASGGGTADRCIRFWNTLSGASLNKIDTGSQVCNLAWSQNCNEIVSTHGYSLNQIVVWRYPSMSKVTTLTGHTYRVLYLAMSPDGSTVVTGAGDETLRFWQVFPGPRSNAKNGSNGLLFPQTIGSVIR